MDGIHDLGGMDGFGHIEEDENNAPFQAYWEGRIFAIAEILSSNHTIPNSDAFRHAIERMDPVEYLTGGYYGRWLAGISILLNEHDIVPHSETQQLLSRLYEIAPTVRNSTSEAVWSGINDTPADATDCRRALPHPPKFSLGDRVCTTNKISSCHTRLPRYARAKQGNIHKYHGGWVYPDSNAHGLGENPQHLYTVSFTGDQLWGDDADPGIVIYLDLYEPYLKKVKP
tara:strand:+ start:556 stop:1239 length:684 start_codon:yes stop_codon:yes gene_type:complete